MKDKSVYVLFEIEDPSILGSLVQLEEDVPLCLMVWTTTPWTLPANLAVAVNPESDYGLYTMTVRGERREVTAIIARQRLRMFWLLNWEIRRRSRLPASTSRGATLPASRIGIRLSIGSEKS